MPDYEITGMFIAAWGMILPLYYFFGEVKSHIKSCPLCKEITDSCRPGGENICSR